MNTLFQNILTASFHGSIVILAVMLLRLALKKTPRKYICLLWLLAGLRLLMPFQIQSDLSLQPSADPVAQVQQFSHSQAPAAPEDFSPADVEAPAQMPAALPDIQSPVTTVISSTPSPAPETTPEPDTGFDFLSVLPWFWLGIACCFGIYSLYTYLTLKLKVREAVKIPGGWECDRIETAFILGFIRPNIYIPMGMTPEEQRYILAHERTHLDKGDHWFKMVGFLALALHWFNPLVWAAYILLCKDIEIACDERVVQFMELDERKAYSAALLNCSTNRAHFAACPVAFGEVSVKERIKSVLSYKKPSFWISLVGVIAIVFVAVCLVTSPARKDAAAAGDTEPTSVSDAVSVHNVDELLAAIAPDTVIQLEPGTYNLSGAKGYGLPSESPYYAWTEKYDGFELMLQNVKNLTIRGSGKVNTTLECDPRSASVINLKNCENVTLEDFTAGHTLELGQCSSGVIYLQNCTGTDMNRLGIYGCGMIGLQAADSKDISLADSDVYDCSSSAAEIISCEDVTISGTRIYRIGSEEYGGYTYFDIGSSRNVTVENCEISDSSLMYLAIVSGSTVQMKGNLFSNNRSQLEAFNFQYEYHEDTQTPADESSMVLDGNRFENCSVRRWFGDDGTITDGAGNPLTDEQMNKLYSTGATEPTQAQLEIHVSTVDELIAALSGGEHREGNYCVVPVVHTITLGGIVDLLYSFKEMPGNLAVPDLGDPFTKKLYSTYLSYLPKEKFSYPVQMNTDDRGSFTEIIRTPDRGQFSVNISKPGVTKGQHWHHTKNEKFVVVSGHGLIQLRKIGTDEVIRFEVSGEKIEVIEMIPGYTHNIINLSQTEDLVTFMWANEPFDPNRPDTYFETVETKN